MDKIWKEFDVDFGYFSTDKQVNKAKGTGASINNQGTIYNFPEDLIKQLNSLVSEIKTKEAKIKELEALLKNRLGFKVKHATALKKVLAVTGIFK